MDINGLSIEYGSMADMAGNYLSGISARSARMVDFFVPDTIRPQLLSFVADMLILTFSEPVLASSISIAHGNFTLQSRYFRLGLGYVRSQDENHVVNMKIPGLLRNKQSTYLLINELAATDLSGNTVIPYVNGLALACKTYIVDSDPPVIM
eukprot:gene22124-28645_t